MVQHPVACLCAPHSSHAGDLPRPPSAWVSWQVSDAFNPSSGRRPPAPSGGRRRPLARPSSRAYGNPGGWRGTPERSTRSSRKSTSADSCRRPPNRSSPPVGHHAHGCLARKGVIGHLRTRTATRGATAANESARQRRPAGDRQRLSAPGGRCPMVRRSAARSRIHGAHVAQSLRRCTRALPAAGPASPCPLATPSSAASHPVSATFLYSWLEKPASWRSVPSRVVRVVAPAGRRSSPARVFARAITSSSIASVSRPVKVLR